LIGIRPNTSKHSNNKMHLTFCYRKLSIFPIKIVVKFDLLFTLIWMQKCNWKKKTSIRLKVQIYIRLAKLFFPSPKSKSRSKVRFLVEVGGTKICSGVNFINVKCTIFLYEHRFSSFYYVHVTRKKVVKTTFERKIRTFNIDEIDGRIDFAFGVKRYNYQKKMITIYIKELNAK